MDLTYPNFFDQELLQTKYFRRHKRAYEEYFHQGCLNKYRCYPVIVDKLQSIFEYRASHAKSFAKRLKSQQNDMRSCEATVSEVIVYSHYIPLVKQGVVKALDIRKDDYDLKIEPRDQPEIFLEILCVMPELTGAYEVKSHKQTGPSSIREKLLRKMQKQNQMQKNRENWAVIDLNNVSIAGEFTVLSSLSHGYKVTLDRETRQVVQRGYDWNNSIFDAPETQSLHGIIHFDLGCYEDRRYILNGRVRPHDSDEKPAIP
jgi:hypothetical protein